MVVYKTLVNLSLLVLVVVFPLVLACNCPNGSTLVDFDRFNGHESLIIGEHNGLNWINVYTVNRNVYPQSGYNIPLTSGQNVAFNGFGNPMSIVVGNSSTIETFNISHFVGAASWNNNLTLSMTGQRLGRIIYNKQVILRTVSATNVFLDWKYIDQITFSASVRISPASSSNTHFALDSLCISTNAKPRPERLYKCDYYGDPHLIKFPKSSNETVIGIQCQITGPSILYRSSYVLINVINSGPSNGDIVTSFNMTLYDTNYIPLCTLNPNDVMGTPRYCGSDVVISKNGLQLNVAYQKALFSAWITYSSWGGGHYKFTLFAPLQQTNHPATTGMCVKGCIATRSTPQLIITDLTTDKEIVTSALAENICDTYLKQVTQRLSRNDLITDTTPGYVDAVREACIIDVTITGSTQFAEDCIRNVITDVLTHNEEIDIDKLNNTMETTREMTEETRDKVKTEVDTMIEASTWPCQPTVSICIMPSLKRQQF